jgi:hypothetical protein
MRPLLPYRNRHYGEMVGYQELPKPLEQPELARW